MSEWFHIMAELLGVAVPPLFLIGLILVVGDKLEEIQSSYYYEEEEE